MFHVEHSFFILSFSKIFLCNSIKNIISKNENKKILILSIEGGGIRGLLPVEFLYFLKTKH